MWQEISGKLKREASAADYEIEKKMKKIICIFFCGML
jgi:hypothetical protein